MDYILLPASTSSPTLLGPSPPPYMFSDDTCRSYSCWRSRIRHTFLIYIDGLPIIAMTIFRKRLRQTVCHTARFTFTHVTAVLEELSFVPTTHEPRIYRGTFDGLLSAISQFRSGFKCDLIRLERVDSALLSTQASDTLTKPLDRILLYRHRHPPSYVLHYVGRSSDS
jgi:hypothetical protein